MEKTSESIITEHVGYSLIAGAIPVPLVDIISITAIQMDMILQLSKLYNIDFNEEKGKSLVSALISSSLGSYIGRIGASVVKTVPVFGTIFGIGTQVVLAGATTYAVGKIFEEHFKQGGNLINFDIYKEDIKKQFKTFFNQGKDISDKMSNKRTKEDILSTIDKLKELKDKGTISEEEFNSTKEELLKRL